MITIWDSGLLRMQADSESFLVKGALALLCEVYNCRRREEIQAFTCHLLEDPGFSGRLTGEQRKGLASILERLHEEAAQ